MVFWHDCQYKPQGFSLLSVDNLSLVVLTIKRPFAKQRTRTYLIQRAKQNMRNCRRVHGRSFEHSCFYEITTEIVDHSDIASIANIVYLIFDVAQGGNDWTVFRSSKPTFYANLFKLSFIVELFRLFSDTCGSSVFGWRFGPVASVQPYNVRHSIVTIRWLSLWRRIPTQRVRNVSRRPRPWMYLKIVRMTFFTRHDVRGRLTAVLR